MAKLDRVAKLRMGDLRVILTVTEEYDVEGGIKRDGEEDVRFFTLRSFEDFRGRPAISVTWEKGSFELAKSVPGLIEAIKALGACLLQQAVDEDGRGWVVIPTIPTD